MRAGILLNCTLVGQCEVWVLMGLNVPLAMTEEQSMKQEQLASSFLE